jgi:hypothetical protein
MTVSDCARHFFKRTKVRGYVLMILPPTTTKNTTTVAYCEASPPTPPQGNPLVSLIATDSRTYHRLEIFQLLYG